MRSTTSSGSCVFVALGLVAAGIAPRDADARSGTSTRCSCWAARSCCCSLVLIPGIGHEVNGSRRWIRLGFMNFQVSEARARPAAHVRRELRRAARRRAAQRTSRASWSRSACSAAPPCCCCCEPDFGAATVLLATGLAVLFLAGARVLHLLVPVVLGVAGARASLAVISPYRLRRLTGFLDPWGDPFDSGFQLTQSLIAIGRGEWFGVGLGASVQKLFYLPEAHTDFVFAVLAEEFGFVGVLVVVALFALLVGRALVISREAAQAGPGVPVLRRRGHRHLARAAGVRQHRREHGPAADQGPDAAAAVATAAAACWSRSAGSACCCASTTRRRRPVARRAVPREARRAMTAQGRNGHGGRHRRARLPGARDGARAAAARLRDRLARHAARHRGAAGAGRGHSGRVAQRQRAARQGRRGAAGRAVPARRAR